LQAANTINKSYFHSSGASEEIPAEHNVFVPGDFAASTGLDVVFEHLEMKKRFCVCMCVT